MGANTKMEWYVKSNTTEDIGIFEAWLWSGKSIF